MRKLLLLTLACFCVGVRAQADRDKTANLQVIAGPFDWTGDLEAVRQMPSTITGAFNPPAPTVLWFKAGSTNPTIYTLRTLGPSIVSKITSKHYAIIGHLKYSNVAAGSFLEMENWFAPEQPGGPEGFYYSRTLAEAGSLAKIEGSDDDREFALPFDATGAKTPLVRLVMKLHAMGPGDFQISNVRLVQYPDTASDTATGASTPDNGHLTIRVSPVGDNGKYSIPGVGDVSLDDIRRMANATRTARSPQEFSIIVDDKVTDPPLTDLVICLHGELTPDGKLTLASATSPSQAVSGDTPSPPILAWRSFTLGIVATLAAIGGSALLLVLARRFRGLRHARELRRIASLDV